MDQKRIMIIGGRWSPEPFVQAAKQLNCWVLTTHYDPHLKNILGADEVYFVHPRNLVILFDLFIKHQINAVVHDGDDNALIAAGILCKKFDLPGPQQSSVAFSTNKGGLRTFCDRLKIPQPKFFIGTTIRDLRNGIDHIGGFPVVIKPIDSQWGQGITKIENETEIHDALTNALEHSIAERFIVEKFVEGTVVVVEGYSFTPTNHTVLAVSSKRIRDKKRLLTAELVYPAESEEVLQNKAVVLHQKLIKALGYNFGFSHSEFVAGLNGEVLLLESANRGAAFFISSRILPALTEIKLLDFYIKSAIGISSREFPLNIPQQKVVALFSTFQFKKGKIKKIIGLKDAQSLPGVLALDLFHREGEYIYDSQRHGYMAITLETMRETRAREQEIRSLVSLTYQNNFLRTVKDLLV